jgi:hypothetical protein
MVWALLTSVTPTAGSVPNCHSLPSYWAGRETQPVRHPRSGMLSSSALGQDEAVDDEIAGNSSRSPIDLSARRAERETRYADLE